MIVLMKDVLPGAEELTKGMIDYIRSHHPSGPGSTPADSLVATMFVLKTLLDLPGCPAPEGFTEPVEQLLSALHRLMHVIIQAKFDADLEAKRSKQ